MTATPILTKDYIINEVIKGNRQWTANKLNKLIDKFTKIHNNEHILIIEIDRKDKELKVIQPVEKRTQNIMKDHDNP